MDGNEEGYSGESWQDMPQVKGLKELKLPVGNETETDGYGGFSCRKRQGNDPSNPSIPPFSVLNIEKYEPSDMLALFLWLRTNPLNFSSSGT